MKKKAFFLRLFYWTGALLDGLMLIPMLIPEIGGIFFFGNAGFQPSFEYRFAMGMGASLMAGWTALLLWAGGKPLERKGILLLTVFPVLTGIILNSLVIKLICQANADKILWKITGLVILASAAVFLYFYVNGAKKGK